MGTRLEPPLAIVESPQQVSCGAGAVGVLGLPFVAELRDSSLLARGDEDRVVAEPVVAARFIGDPAFEDAGAAQLLARRTEGHQLADVTGAAALPLDVAKLAEQAADGVAPAEARRADPRGAAEALDLEPRVLAQ